MEISPVRHVREHVRSRARTSSVPAAVTPYTARFESPPTTPLRSNAFAEYRARYRSAFCCNGSEQIEARVRTRDGGAHDFQTSFRDVYGRTGPISEKDA